MWWIALGLLLLISLFTMIMGLNAVKRMFYMPSIQYPIFRVIIAATAVGYFLSAFLGCIHIFSQLPVNDKSVIIFPLIISAFIFAGSTFGLFLADD